MNTKTARHEFIPAKPSSAMIWLVQHLSMLDLAWRNKVHMSVEDVKKLQNLPRPHGLVLTPNHADEIDPRLCFEVSRKAKQQFLFMCNREAFHELRGFAGWVLQRIGAYSVERGGHDSLAKQYSIDIVKESKNTLVIFPEGEIFYLNQSLQPFHSGAIEIGMQAIIEKRVTDPNWTTFLIPMSIRYHYVVSIKKELEKRIKRMEVHLEKHYSGTTAESRLTGIMNDAITEKERRHHIAPETEHLGDVAGRVEYLRTALLAEVGKKYKGSYKDHARTIDQAFQLSAHLREELSQTVSQQHQAEYKEDLSTLQEVQHLVAWHPDYVKENPSPERIAEMVIKLERELLNIHRPEPLGKREVFIKIGTPLDLSTYLERYKTEPYVVRSEVAELLRSEIQLLIDLDLKAPLVSESL